MKKTLLFVSVFVCGACVMILELVGSRVMAPFFGTGIYIWASLIGVILGAMSLGYTWGGRMADKGATFEQYSLIIASCALMTAGIGALKNVILAVCGGIGLTNTAGGLLAAILLFVPVAVGLALISPYAIKLLLNSLNNSGKTAGNIYAVSTAGSITGTFLAGFYLVPRFGNTAIITAVSFILILLAFALSPTEKFSIKAGICAIIIIAAFYTQSFAQIAEIVIDEVDTQYSTVSILEENNVRTMLIGDVPSSARYLDSDELVYEYTKLYDLAFSYKDNVDKALAIGGAGYSYPQHFLRMTAGEIDVVEIDPGVTELARKYFGLVDNPRMSIFHEDGRIFLNNNQTQYDAIFGDAFASFAPPYQLVTKEATEKISASLADDGVFIVNVIDKVEGGEFLKSYYSTLSEVFPHILVFLSTDRPLNSAQNITLVAFKQTPIQRGNSPLLDKQWVGTVGAGQILTDEYAPVEFLTRGNR